MDTCCPGGWAKCPRFSLCIGAAAYQGMLTCAWILQVHSRVFGAHVKQKKHRWTLGAHSRNLHFCWKWKRRGMSTVSGYTKFQPVRLDMTSFGDKRVARKLNKIIGFIHWQCRSSICVQLNQWKANSKYTVPSRPGWENHSPATVTFLG